MLPKIGDLIPPRQLVPMAIQEWGAYIYGAVSQNEGSSHAAHVNECYGVAQALGTLSRNVE